MGRGWWDSGKPLPKGVDPPVAAARERSPSPQAASPRSVLEGRVSEWSGLLSEDHDLYLPIHEMILTGGLG